MVITDGEVYWCAIGKHTDTRVETRPIDYATVERAAAHAEEVHI